MKNLEINGKDYQLPTTLADLKFKDYLSIYQGISGDKNNTIDDKILVISHLLGEEKEFVESLPLEIFNLLFEEVSWIFAAPSYKPSDSVKIGKETYTITPIEKWPLRKYIEAEESVKGGDKNYLTLLGIILTPNEGYSLIKANELSKKMEDFRADKVVPLLAFFLLIRKVSDVITRLCSAVESLEATVQSARNPKR